MAYRFEETKENVSVYCAFMCLVQHDDGVLHQVGINETFTQQHAVRHVLYHSLRTGAIFKSNCVANLTHRQQFILLKSTAVLHTQPSEQCAQMCTVHIQRLSDTNIYVND